MKILEKILFENLSEKLLQWTGKRWVITLAKGKKAKNFFRTSGYKKKRTFRTRKKRRDLKKFKNIFSDGELIEVSKKIKLWTDFSDLISQAKKMQEKMKETQETLKKIEVEGISGGNTVR